MPHKKSKPAAPPWYFLIPPVAATPAAAAARILADNPAATPAALDLWLSGGRYCLADGSTVLVVT